MTRQRQIASLKRQITEAVHYVETHPDASVVSERLNELRAELRAITRYCKKCGAGYGEYLACEMPDCEIENVAREVSAP